MTADEEYLDNLLKAFEEEEQEREQNAPQEKQIITDVEDVDEELLASLLGSLENDDLQGGLSTEGESGAEADNTFSVEDEEWKMNLDELLANVDAEAEANTSELESLLAESANAETELFQEPAESKETEKKESSFMAYDIDVTEYIDDLDDADNSLMELNELLKKADNNESIEVTEEIPEGLPEDLLKSFQENGELTEEVFDSEPEKKSNHLFKKQPKEKRRGGRKSKKAINGVDSVDNDTVMLQNTDIQPDGTENSKKTSFFGNVWQRLVFEEESEEKITGEGDENGSQEIREEKKKKKDKKNKKKKGDEKENAEADLNADGDDLEESEKDKKKKKKKEKKEKKKKENIEDIVDLPKQKPQKVLTKSALMVLIAFGATFVAAIVFLSIFLPDFTDKNKAREAFYDGNYDETYTLLYGKHLNENDTLLLNRVESVLQIERCVESYYLYEEIGEKAKALDALFEGIRHCADLTDINEYGSGPEIMIAYNRILDILKQQYGIEEAEALEIITYDDVRYSVKVYETAEGMVFGETEEETEQEEAPNEGPQDILPEEEDIITLETENEGA